MTKVLTHVRIVIVYYATLSCLLRPTNYLCSQLHSGEKVEMAT